MQSNLNIENKNDSSLKAKGIIDLLNKQHSFIEPKLVTKELVKKIKQIPGFELKTNHSVQGSAGRMRYVSIEDGSKLFYIYYNKNNEDILIQPEEAKPPVGYKKLQDAFGRYPNLEDPNFHINVNRIKNMNFIAAPGPKRVESEEDYSDDLDAFFQDTVFNKKCPIKKVIALGSCVSSAKERGDFLDYCLMDRTDFPVGSFCYSSVRNPEKGSVSVKNEPHYVLVQKSEGIMSVHQEGEHAVVTPQGILHSSLSIYEKNDKEKKHTLDVTFITLADGHSIDLTEDKDNSIKDTLLDLCRQSRDENVLVHCSAGIGRTGHLILTLEILRNYKAIFEAKDVGAAVAKINALMKDLREDRLCMIPSIKQFYNAISNAEILYRYAIEKGYDLSSLSYPDRAPSDAKPVLAGIGMFDKPSGVVKKSGDEMPGQMLSVSVL